MNKEGKVFAGKRSDGPANAWQMPQGGIDRNEQPAAAALRELEEETGVEPSAVEMESATEGWLSYDLPVDIAGKIWGGKYRGQRQKWFLFRFLGTDDMIRIDASDAEFSEWKWLSPDELIELIVPFKREVYEAVFEELLPD